LEIYNSDCITGTRKYLEDNSIDLIVTDPPYGIYGDQLHKHYNRQEDYVVDGYVEVAPDEYAAFSFDWIKEAERVLRPGGSMYIVSGYTNLIHIMNALRQTRLVEKNHIIWKYNFGVYTSKKYVSSHYHILYYVKPGAPVTFNTFSRFGSLEKNKQNHSENYRDREDVWIINREFKPGKTKNKNELPEQLLIKILQYSSNENDLVCDFFLGGFSTARVAIGLNRRITGFEINSHSFLRHLNLLKKLKPGFLLDSIKNGIDQTPNRQGQPWDETEIKLLHKRYEEIYQQLKHKRKTIEKLQVEFQRGYFSILNKL